jgi:hypothetical protein
MKCKVCDKVVMELLKHLMKNKPCQGGYDVEQIRETKKQERLEKKRRWSREKYERNKDEILKKREEHYEVNKESIRDAQAEYYNKNKDARAEYYEKNKDARAEYYEKNKDARAEYLDKNKEIIREAQAEYYDKNKESVRAAQAEYHKRSKNFSCQRKRFRKHFTKENAWNYLTGHQVHLYHHTRGICQSETLKEFNHSVEYYDGLCNFCNENQGVKLVGVNRQVCLGCNRAKCTVCEIETSPNPELGCLHYSPDMGTKLGFIPGHCPLYSKPGFWRYSNQICITNQVACKLCNQIVKDHPEYSLFGEMVKLHASSSSWSSYDKVDVFVYACNLCGNKSNFICEFDLHMRSHTRWGKRVAIVAIGTPPDQEHLGYDRVSRRSFVVLEKELMKAGGISAVLSIFKKGRLERLFKKDNLEDVNLVATMLLKEGVNINDELKNVSIDQQIIEKLVVVEVRSHFLTDDSSAWGYYGNESEYSAKKSFEELLRWKDPPVQDFDPVADSWWYQRSTALLASRCSLLCPGEDRYQGLPESSPPDFSSHVLQFLWSLVKHSGLCCCVSKFFCSTSTDLEKCKQGCCGKCEVETLSGLGSEQSETDADEMTENEEEVSEKGEDDSEDNDDGDWWEDQ